MMERGLVLELHGIGLSQGATTHLDRISLSLAAGERLIVLGETGSGREALMRVLGGFPEKGDVITGTIRYAGGPPVPAGSRSKPALRTAYLPNPLSHPLVPHASVAAQLTRIVARKLNAPFGSAREELRLALERLPGAVTLPLLDAKPTALDPVTIATGLIASVSAQTPDLVLAESPFADLGPKAIKTLLNALDAEQQRLNYGLIYATGGLSPIARLGGRVLVLRAGKVVEEGSAERLMSGHAHAYTRRLFEALPRLVMENPRPRSLSRGQPLLQFHNVPFGSEPPPKNLYGEERPVRDGVTFEIRRGASLALIGEPQSGRHALLRLMLGVDPAPSGRVLFDAVDLNVLSEGMAARIRRRVAYISGRDDTLDPRMTLWDTVEEPLRAHLNISGELIAGYREAALKRVGLASHDGKLPVSVLSPFDKRRLAVARAFVGAPLLVVVDEPLTGLDAFAQNIMREVLIDFRATQGPAFLVLTSDFTIAQALAEDALVLEGGKIVEKGAIAHLVHSPKHDATKALIDAVSLSREAASV
ncbi:ABC-type glutathione transport system ATPase component [Rhizomicrobium palustre]|uniref:ABC-type glutathione transport system ATPase component n=1 Tax=Rhizomicrobium palustre TaxID=189966 RepID=A0A846MX50_9PROT|nr:ATP-binding cassette domain-containing protein [Rhizomicrobium palustre]NIK87986.1 ABC-type glutathione transport system ATPase component [Rhizomicrobium palustre]